MAIAEANLDEGLNDEDRALVASLGTPSMADASPVPELPETEIVEPPAVIDAVPTGDPESIDSLIAETAGGTSVPPAQSVNPAIPATSASAAPEQRAVDVAKATALAKVADQQAAIAKEADEDARLAHADYLEQRGRAESDLNAKVAAFEKAALQGPPERKHNTKSRLAVIFGGLGAMFRGAGGGDTKNRGLEQVQKDWEDEAARHKAGIAALKDSAVMARTRIGDIDAGRRQMQQSVDASLVAKYNSALKQGEAQLKNQGVPQAQIDADTRIVQLKAARDKAQAQALKDADAHALNQARIRSLDARAKREAAKGKGGGKGSAGALDAQSQIAEFVVNNPGDVAGAYKLAGELRARGVKIDGDAVGKVLNQTKSTESQNKDAKQSAIGTRALDDIQRSGYKPSKEDIQKWLNNQREVYQAQKAGEGGGLMGLAGGYIAGKAQGAGLLAQSEVEGLPDEAQGYFANVRRFMETIGRAQSGAAISPTEWQNFFNQYGPNSPGGLEAARKYLGDQKRAAGVAGRQIEAGGKPGKAAPSADQDSEAVAWAKKNLGDPRARKILKANGL